MSYSFSVKAESKTAAILAAEDKFKAEVLARNPIHAKDEAVAFNRLREHMALIPDPNADESIEVTMHGSIWAQDGQVRSCSSGCSVGIGRK